MVREKTLEAEENPEPWSTFAAGDGFSIRSLSGNEYVATYLGVGPPAAGVYVRLENGSLGRLDPARLRWSTCEKLLSTSATLYRDEVVFTLSDTREEVRGSLNEAIEDRILVTARDGETVAVPLTRVNLASFRLAFRSAKIYPGEEFRVTSSSGREYRGTAETVNDTSIRALLVGEATAVTIRRDKLQPGSLRVLVPVKLNLLHCSPSG